MGGPWGEEEEDEKEDEAEIETERDDGPERVAV